MIGVAHHFVGGLYAKETHIPAGEVVCQHIHPFDHLSALMSGTADVECEGVVTRHHAPELMTIEAGKTHSVRAITDVIWLCLHATDETDPERVDAAILKTGGS